MSAKRRYLVWGLLLIIGLLSLTWLHYHFVIARIDFANRDFMSLWTGGRALLLGLDPYDEAVWKSLRAAHGSGWFPDSRAPFPLWTFLLTAPFALLPVSWAAAAWLVFSEFLLVLNLAALAGPIAGWRPSPAGVGLLLLGSFGSIITVLVLENGQMTFLLLSLLTLYMVLQPRHPFWAGFVIAGILFKPNPFILLAPLLALWWFYRRRWTMIAGGVVGVSMLMSVSWLLRPGWLAQWLDVRGKTEVVTITPTVWGLAADLAPSAWWLWGFLLVVLITAITGYNLFVLKPKAEPAVVAIAIAASLLVTPYTWTYEHALLFIPWFWIYTRLPRLQGSLAWLALAWLLPWLLFLLSAVRVRETWALLSPLLALSIVIALSTEGALLPFRRGKG